MGVKLPGQKRHRESPQKWEREVFEALRELDRNLRALTSIGVMAVSFSAETVKRVTVTDVAVTSTSVVMCGIQRPTVAESSDRGYVYVVNVVGVRNGEFDALIAATVLGCEEPAMDPPTETVQLLYQVG